MGKIENSMIEMAVHAMKEVIREDYKDELEAALKKLGGKKK